MLQELERPLEVPTVGNVNYATLASVDPCQGEMPQAYIRCHLMPRHSQKHCKCAKYAHANVHGDSSTHYDALKDVYVPSEFENPDQV